MKKFLFIAATSTILAMSNNSEAEQAVDSRHILKKDPLHSGEMGFPDFTQPVIPGAPRLSDLMLIMGETKPVQSGKHGLAAPALWDWNGDGKRDLLIGEFETCTEGHGFPGGELYGSTVRVYLNVGTDRNPQFSDDYFFAKDTEGTYIEVPQWCCIGFTPMFYDLDNDGFKDLVTGQYHPGDVTWFRGSEKGFLPGAKLKQFGDSSAEGTVHSGFQGGPEDPGSFAYWNYSSVGFGDFTENGKLDMIVGGHALRISKNIGTKENPEFGRREYLLDVNGKPLVMKYLSKEILEQYQEWGGEPNVSGSGKIQVFVTDWNNDGINDILATDYYLDSGSRAVSYFEGVKTTGGHRFKQGVDLLATADGSKALPGSGNRLYVDDWNKDGIQDLIVGASIVTVRNKFHDEFSWQWESITGIQSAGKDAGHPATISLKPGTLEEELKKAKENWNERWGPFDEDKARQLYLQRKQAYEESQLKGVDPKYSDKEAYRHQGRIYVFLGEHSETQINSGKIPEAQPEGAREVAHKKKPKKKRTAPVQYTVIPSEVASEGSSIDIVTTIDVKKGWYIYAPTGRNEMNGMTETRITFNLPEGFKLAGNLELPPHHAKGMYEIYDGDGIRLIQPLRVSEEVVAGEYTIEGELSYQTCNAEMCLPPKTEQFVIKVAVE